MNKLIYILLAIFLSSCATLDLQTVRFNPRTIKYPKTITHPLELEDWLQKDFTYQEDENNKWKTPQQTIRDKGGDCEDFATLNANILKQLGYETYIFCLMYKTDSGEISGHAIAIFKDEINDWNYFSNRVYMPTPFKNEFKMLTYFYPTWYKLYIFDTDCKLLKVYRL